jgi:hypothetical protein
METFLNDTDKQLIITCERETYDDVSIHVAPGERIHLNTPLGRCIGVAVMFAKIDHKHLLYPKTFKNILTTSHINQ